MQSHRIFYNNNKIKYINLFIELHNLLYTLEIDYYLN